MTTLIDTINKALLTISTTPKENHIKTGDIRTLSANLYRSLDKPSKAQVFKICHDLLEQRNWAMGLIAYDFAYRVRKQYTHDDFEIFESWLKNYVRGWGDCDDFCTHALGALLCQFPHLFKHVLNWTTDEAFWVRRASAVVLIPIIKKGLPHNVNPFEISDRLMHDDHDLVRKGYGWMLKVYATQDEPRVFDYLVMHQGVMPRVSFRYASEKMSVENRQYLMSL